MCTINTSCDVCVYKSYTVVSMVNRVLSISCMLRVFTASIFKITFELSNVSITILVWVDLKFEERSSHVIASPIIKLFCVLRM